MILAGLGTLEIAKRMYLSPKTVEQHMYNLRKKALVRTNAQLIVYAVQVGWGTIPPLEENTEKIIVDKRGTCYV